MVKPREALETRCEDIGEKQHLVVVAVEVLRLLWES